MSAFDPVAYLASKGLRGRPASGGREVVFPCFFDCNEPPDSRKRKLYVNAEEGFYQCKICGSAGGSATLQRHFGDDPKAGSTDDAFTRRRILNWAAKVGAEILQNRDDVLLYLINERGLGPETIVNRQLGFVGDGWSLTGELPGEFTRTQLAQTGLVWKDGAKAGKDFFYQHLLIPVTARGHVVQIRGRVWGEARGGKYLSGPGEPVRAYNIDSLDGADDVVLTEGEFDAIRLQEVLSDSDEPRVRRIAVVGLPGTNAFPEDLDDYLAAIKRIYVGFDSDEPGRIAAEKLRERYGPRARILTLPNEGGRKCDWCVDEETEALTERGWLRHDEIQVGDRVWSLNPETGMAGWRPVTKLYRRHRSRQMIRLAGKRHDSVTTDNHRWPVINQGGRLVWRTTESLRSHDRVLTSASPEVDVPERYADELVELVAWWVAEGSPRRAGGLEISQSETANPVHCERIRRALKVLFGSAVETSYGPRGAAFWREYRRSDGIILFTLSARAATHLTECAPDCVPMPSFLAALSQRQLNLFLDTLVDGDGWRGGVTAIGQTREPITRAIEMACVLAGRSFATHTRANRSGSFGSRPMHDTTLLRRHTALVRHVTTQEVIDYEGVVWCPVVEGTTTWYARRNGTGYFTGNTEYLLPKQDGRSWELEHPYAGHGAGDVLRLMSAAAGRRIYSVAEAGAAWREYRKVSAGLQTGYPMLDAVFHPGLLPGQVVFLLAKTGAGKGHPLQQLLPTPSGYRKCGDLEVGDQVYGSDGRPTTVTGVYDRGLLPTYNVRFSDDTSIQVDGDHLWNVSERYGHRREWRSTVLSTRELIEQGLRKGPEYRWIIPMTEPVAYSKAELPVEPYTLGALLANGYLTGSSAYLSTPDREVISRIERHYEVHESKRFGCPRFVIQRLIGKLRQLGVCHPSAEKFIPEQYLTASVDQRIALLQGLMDGDGSTRAGQRRSSVLYFTSSRRLADDMSELVNSLGGTARQWWTQRPGRRPEARITLMLPAGICPFSTSRKLKMIEPKYQRVPRRAIVAIEPAGEEMVRCISVSSPDELYLVGREYVVTHNTLILCNLAYNMRAHRILFVSLEMTREEVYNRLERIYLFHHPRATTDELEQALSLVWICDENRLGEKDLAALVNEFTVEVGAPPEIVFIDYLGYYARGAKGQSPYEKVTNAAMQLKAEAKAARMVVVAPSQVNRIAKSGKPIDLDDARDSGAIEETGDFVIALFRPEDANVGDPSVLNLQPTYVMKIGVLKSRHGGVGKTVELQMDAAYLAVVNPGTPAARRAQEHNRRTWRGDRWEDIHTEYTRPEQLRLPRQKG